ncbi:ester hydrolase C11orf54 homolog [Chrysoperla carnea]|uniref:ester hydrolase C11orf54 homolog n=1 Tax=Chrysoperla carnea TaxID=189513 RepID=UPI001D09491A|nr:ester hydrolase C11orf54 homolog [Chrysoperla carnea]
MALDIKNLKLEQKILHQPPLNEVAEVLNNGLKNNFSTVQVEVVDCPDLTQRPFTLACKGLGGKANLLEIGGPPFLMPLVNRNKVYELKQIPEALDLDPAFIIGASAGPFPHTGVSCEEMVNLYICKNKLLNQSRISKVNVEDTSRHILETLPESETRCSLLANLFCSNGNAGKVLKVHCKKRTGNDDFIAAIRKTLMKFYKEKVVGLGGTFLLKEGQAKQHVMPDFSKTPITSGEDFNDWLKFYNMSAPLIAVGTLVTGQTELDLRVQHFHSFSHHGEGGHYHIDTTPDSVEYLGYFNLGKILYRLDRPNLDEHQMIKFERF